MPKVSMVGLEADRVGLKSIGVLATSSPPKRNTSRITNMDLGADDEINVTALIREYKESAKKASQERRRQ